MLSRDIKDETVVMSITSLKKKTITGQGFLELTIAFLLLFSPPPLGISRHAAMMFDTLNVNNFNPVRDVWFPLDLSNAASFNAVMAHSAAHLARMQGLKIPREALNYKAEAVRIVMWWINDSARALSDEVLAAVLRLLAYEVCVLSLQSSRGMRRNGKANIVCLENSEIGGPRPSGRCIMMDCIE